jgi:anti-sigma28 factor (negative regulator of flagellin synthesis)
MVAVALIIPDLRAARVRALKAQISARTYQVTAEQVAESLLEQMQVSWKAGGHRQSFGA